MTITAAPQTSAPSGLAVIVTLRDSTGDRIEIASWGETVDEAIRWAEQLGYWMSARAHRDHRTNREDTAMTATETTTTTDAMAAELLDRGPAMGAERQQDADELAGGWISVDCDLDEMREALDAGCWEPRAWRELRDAGLTAAQIGRRIRVPRGDYEATIGYAVSNGDMSAAEAVALSADR